MGNEGRIIDPITEADMSQLPFREPTAEEWAEIVKELPPTQPVPEYLIQKLAEMGWYF